MAGHIWLLLKKSPFCDIHLFPHKHPLKSANIDFQIKMISVYTHLRVVKQQK